MSDATAIVGVMKERGNVMSNRIRTTVPVSGMQEMVRNDVGTMTVQIATIQT